MHISQIRADMKLSGAEFARRIGASPGQLHDWESGRQPMTIEAAAKVEAALGITGLVAAVAQERAFKATSAAA